MTTTIDQVWAYVAVDPDDDTEGICAFWSAGMETWMPMVAADEDRVRALRPMAEVTAATTGRDVRLVRFTARTDMETITPTTTKE